MNGARADASANTRKVPSNSREITIGGNHHFFLIFKKDHISFSIDNLFIVVSPSNFILSCISYIQLSRENVKFFR